MIIQHCKWGHTSQPAALTHKAVQNSALKWPVPELDASIMSDKTKQLSLSSTVFSPQYARLGNLRFLTQHQHVFVFLFFIYRLITGEENWICTGLYLPFTLFGRGTSHPWCHVVYQCKMIPIIKESSNICKWSAPALSTVRRWEWYRRSL